MGETRRKRVERALEMCTAQGPARASDETGASVAFVLGGARSGTTWLAKIIDSHPHVIYRHEPDLLDPAAVMPLFCHPDEVDHYLGEARRCVARYILTRHVRAAGVRPHFRKAYLNEAQYRLRNGLIKSLRAAEMIPKLRSLVYAIPVPDFVNLNEDPYCVLIKSIGSMGRVNLLLRANPNARFVIIIRHPCGYVASRLRQPDANRSWSRVGVGLPQAEQARRRGLSRQAIETMSPVQRLAWVWTIFNEKAMEDAANRPNVRVLRYEDLCLSPVAVARDLFMFIGLEWHRQTEGFLSQSTSRKGAGHYYSIFRDTKLEISKWKKELSEQQVRTVLEITRDSAPGRLFLDD